MLRLKTQIGYTRFWDKYCRYLNLPQKNCAVCFQYALENRRKKVTWYKANIMKFTDGLFLQVARQVAQEFVGKIIFEAIVDNMTMQLVQNRIIMMFWCCLIFMEILFLIFVQDWFGGLGLLRANIGNQMAVFEAVRFCSKYKGRIKPILRR